MTNAQILAACRSNWEYRGIDDASVREMLDELSAHLADAEAAGRTGQDVIGHDVRTFAAAWARARSPLPRRVLRMVCLGAFVLGCLLLLTCLTRWTTESAVTPGSIAFWAVLGVATVVWELRRGSLGMLRSWGIGLCVALPAAIVTRRLAGDAAVLTVPLWAAALLLLPGLPYAVADVRARRRAAA
ncbi:MULTISPECIES: hypothetical protein [Streptomyces]|uniref:hypothetical protein n=1 Tax=Streptomyces TaxID=1883 RepID=UPI0006B06C6F|nr:hypothetical protein [Streptomyces sp. H021]KOV28634.1 hypothetical protein ADK97_34285 [Streptomyces sp. H021]